MPERGERSTEVATTTTRNAAVDAARLLFAFGVVVIHLAPSETESGGLLARFFLISSVQYFFLISLTFFIGRVTALEDVRWRALHFDRLIVPYATWTMLYTLLRVAKSVLLQKPLDLEIIGIALYGGGAMHLYFLPILVLWQSLALSILVLLRTPPRWLMAGSILAAAAVFAAFGKARGYYCFDRAFSTGCIYVALAFLLHFTQLTTLGRRLNAGAGVLIAAAVVAATFLSPFRPWLGPFAAYSAAALALNWNLRIGGRVLRYGFSCAYAIYLAHLAFVETLKLTAARLGFSSGLDSAIGTALAAAGICVLCIGLAALARQHPIPRYFLLGEGSIGRVSR